MNKDNVVKMFNCSVDDNLNLQNGISSLTNVGLGGYTENTGIGGNFDNNLPYNNQRLTAWNYWQDYYYPYVIKESYPVYIQERAMDKGAKAFEILKILNDKKLAKLEKVSDFIELMDALIKIL